MRARERLLFLLLLLVLLMSGWDSRRSQVAGVVVLTLWIALVLSFFVDVSRTVTVIDATFTLGSGETEKTRYVPQAGVDVLQGRVSVEGEGIHFAVPGWDLGIENVFVDNDFTFTIDPAWGWDHIYLFTFNNTAGDAESHVSFVLDETLTESALSLFLRSIGLPQGLVPFYGAFGVFAGMFVLPFVSCILFAWSLFQEEGNPPLPQASRAMLFVISFSAIFISYLFVRQEYFNALLTAIVGISIGILAGVWIYRSYKKRLTHA